MGEEGGHQALSSRLSSFRKWVQNAGCKVHSAVCIVNGEATDGTRNAPVLILGPSPSSAPVNSVSTAEGRCGLVDTDEDRILYDRTIGCQIRTTRELKEGQIMMTVPKTVMVHPDLIAGSDAGRAALACCEPLEDGANFWDVFGHTAAKQDTYLNKMASAGGTQLLVKILQERKKVETALAKAAKAIEEGDVKDYSLAPKGVVSARAAYLLFLIQQRFADEENPKVASEYDFGQFSTKDDASKSVERLGLLEGTPESFAPYTRTLPPSVALPMCWKRNELATLASCIPGMPLMQEIAAQIMTFSSDLIALVDAGILYRFPSLFSPKLLTWDRWLWAASVHMSRVLPSTCYLNRGEGSAQNHVVAHGELFYSPPEVWNDLGVMVPLMDMLNHEVEESQIKWESPKAADDDDDVDMIEGGKDDDNVAKIMIQKRVKKGSQIYTTYDIESNQNLMLQYGFAQMANNADTVQIGWALQDGVGGTSKPSDYVSMSKTEVEEKAFVYETIEVEIVNSWWTEDRLSVLKRAMRADQSFWSSLRNGKKMISAAHSNGTYEPKLLTAMVVATMSPSAVQKYINAISSAGAEDERKVTLSRQHQNVLRNYMFFLFTRKLERMLQNVGNGLKAHFNNIDLWTKVSQGGLDYNSNADHASPSEPSPSNFTGWNSFFDSFAYNAAMEVETRYYSLAPDSCVLTLYDGHLRALQKSIDGVISESSFKEIVVPILEDLDFIISEEDESIECSEEVIAIEDREEKEDVKTQPGKQENGEESQKKDIGNSEKKEKEKKKNRQRNNRMKQGGPPAVKLHIGNLSYQTVPNRLYEYFAMRYGSNSVIECHIPTERETGKSRGFGFVTMQEAVATKILIENLPHEIDGRVVKLAESNTSVQARGSHNNGAANVPSDRCGTCGYRPRYCKCPSTNMSAFQHGGPIPMMGGPPPPGHIYPSDDIYGPGPGGPPPLGDMGPYDYGRDGMQPDHGGKGSRSLNRGRSYNRSPSPHYKRRGDSRERFYDRRHRRSRSRSYGRSRSRSRSVDRARRSRRSRSYDRDSRRSRRSRGSRRSARYSRSNSPDYSKDVSSSTRRERDRERKLSASGDDINTQGREDRSRSRSIPPQDRSSETDGTKREGGKSNRRTRSKSRDRNSRSRKRSNKGSRRSKERSKRRSRSLSRSRSRSF